MDMCIIRLFEIQNSLVDEYDLPIAILTNELVSVQPLEVMKPVSIVHLCSSSCKLVSRSATRLIERENVELSNAPDYQLVFEHDISNQLYVVNNYCIGNYLH